MGTFALLKERRFGPFFWTQYAGAFNDNLFKNALVIMLAYKATSEADSGLVVNLAAGLFILPFFLFSAFAGQLADKLDKGRLIRAIKLAEVFIMLLGAVGFFLESSPLLFGTLFLMGTQSAFFGPVKYSILPQVLRDDELMDGNGLVEMGTFLAILLGEILGGILASSHNLTAISAGIVGAAIVGYLVSLTIPPAPAAAPGLKLSFDLIKETRMLYRVTRQREGIWNSILGISWFWYFGATMLSQLPSYAKHVLIADESVVTLLLATFSVAIALGSLLCARLSSGEIELGLIPLGAIGMTVFAVDLFFAHYPEAGTALRGVSAFIADEGGGQSWRVLFDLSMIGISSSLFIVPMFAFIQHRSAPDTRSRLIAANNVFNSVLMIASALVTMALYRLGLDTLDILLVTGILNALVCGYVFSLIPEFFMRFVVWVLSRFVYRVRYEGRDLVPQHGAALIVANHVSFIDWFFLTAACRRPVRFVMDHQIFEVPVLGLLFRAAKAIPIAPAKEDAARKEEAFRQISEALRDEQLVCIFPEGIITHTGEISPFKPGVERILEADSVPVVAIGIGGLWGSFFSRKGGPAMKKLPRPSWRHVTVKIRAVASPRPTAVELEGVVRALVA